MEYWVSIHYSTAPVLQNSKACRKQFDQQPLNDGNFVTGAALLFRREEIP
jgi:hypothetical protein